MSELYALENANIACKRKGEILSNCYRSDFNLFNSWEDVRSLWVPAMLRTVGLVIALGGLVKVKGPSLFQRQQGRECRLPFKYLLSILLCVLTVIFKVNY